MNTEELKSCGEVYTKVVIEEISNGTIRVHTILNEHPDVSFWLYFDEVFEIPPTPPVKPAKKYQVGDEVIHINRPQMGIGKIVEVNDGDRTYGIEIDSNGGFIDVDEKLKADYEVDWQFYPNSDYDISPKKWVHAEEFLLPARRKDA